MELSGNCENGTHGTNGHTEQKMLSLEIEAEEEHASLLRETTDDAQDGSTKKEMFMARNSHGMRRRWGVDGGIGHGSQSLGSSSRGMIQGFLRTDLMSHAVYHLRNALVLGLLAFFVLVVLEWEGAFLRSEVMEDTKPVKTPHTFSYGGKYNIGHQLDPDRSKKPLTELEEEDLEAEILDEGAEKIGTWDLAVENKMNEQADYLHDPEKSPFASHLYVSPDDDLNERQTKFAERMGRVKEDFGVWNNPHYEGAFSVKDTFFEEYFYRDVPMEDFPDWAWQKDKDYIQHFLNEASALVEATKEGIMQEYHHPNPNDEEKEFFGVIIGDHDFVDGQATHKETQKRVPGVAFLPEKTWDGLIRKLLHALVTSDHFYVAVVGTDETYKANNLAQTQVMQFNYIMEPIFHKLGMTLISRNMGMSASPAVSALGGADIIGETDILWHVQRKDDEEKPGEFDLIQKQAIMSGERVPIVLSPEWNELMQASKGKAWVGNIQPGEDFCQTTTMEVLPDAPACHHVTCDTKAWESRTCYAYDSVCWELRSDWNPDGQDDDVGDQDKEYPGFRRHQLEGRKMTLLLLNALSSALEIWQQNLDHNKPLPLPTTLWHVGDTYEDIRDAVMSLDRIPGEEVKVPDCEKLLKEVDARICHVPMHAFTEWTPRVMPATSGLTAIINNLVLGNEDTSEPYDGIDVVPLAWMLPEEEVDVHMIAIAANITQGYDDDLFDGMYKQDDWYGDDNDWWDEGEFVNQTDDEEIDDDGDQVRRSLIIRQLRKHNKDKNKTTEADTKVPAEESGQPSDGGHAKGGGSTPAPAPQLFSGDRLQIAEGLGWHLEDAPIGFCDGSAQSRCNRHPDNKCLLANHNHYQGSVVGGPKNKWLTMQVPWVRHGIILARMTFANGSGSPSLSSDFVLDYAVNGVVTSIPGSELQAFGKEIVRGLTVYPFVNDRDAVVDGDSLGISYDIAIRVRSESDPDCVLRLSHIYFA